MVLFFIHDFSINNEHPKVGLAYKFHLLFVYANLLGLRIHGLCWLLGNNSMTFYIFPLWYWFIRVSYLNLHKFSYFVILQGIIFILIYLIISIHWKVLFLIKFLNLLYLLSDFSSHPWLNESVSSSFFKLGTQLQILLLKVIYRLYQPFLQSFILEFWLITHPPTISAFWHCSYLKIGDKSAIHSVLRITFSFLET